MSLRNIIKTYPITFACLAVLAVFGGFNFGGIIFSENSSVFSRIFAFCELAAVIALVVLSFVYLSHFLKRRREQIELVNASLDAEPGGSPVSNLTSFPLPFVTCEADGTIIWYNEIYHKNIINDCLFDILNINENIPFSANIVEKSSFQPIETLVNGKCFTVYPSKLDSDLYVLYFVDDTELKNIREKYFITRPCVLLVNIDSIENTADTYDSTDYSAITGDIERLISGWFRARHCILRKYGEGKFLIITESEYLEKMTEKRFDILEKVRDYRYEDKDPEMTLSIGIGRGDSLLVSETYARQAIEMAKGRGGDQVAVKFGENFEFFGGILSRKEKKGRVRSRAVSSALCDLMLKSDRILIMGHKGSDFDCLGSAVGLCAIASSLGKSANIVFNEKTTMASEILELFTSNKYSGLFVSPEKALEIITPATLLIITDTMRPSIFDCEELYEKSNAVVFIDHHRKGVDCVENADLFFHEPYASSASEMVTELIQYARSEPVLTSEQAEALLAGIILDTKNFSLRMGTRTFEAAAYLEDRKPDLVKVRKMFAGSAEDNIAVNRIVSSAEFHPRYAVAAADIKTPTLRIICSKAADELLNIKNMDASFVLFPIKDGVAISARALGKINVQLIMEALGGGGHQNMSAAQIPGVNIDDAKKMLYESINNYLSANEVK